MCGCLEWLQVIMMEGAQWRDPTSVRRKGKRLAFSQKKPPYKIARWHQAWWPLLMLKSMYFLTLDGDLTNSYDEQGFRQPSKSVGTCDSNHWRGSGDAYQHLDWWPGATEEGSAEYDWVRCFHNSFIWFPLLKHLVGFITVKTKLRFWRFGLWQKKISSRW